MAIEEIWRFPVKSIGGERLDVGDVGPLGLDGDRRWGVRDLDTGRVLTGRREPRLLLASARHLGEGAVAVVLPDGRELAAPGPDVDAVLSAWLERPVALVPSTDPAGGQFEVPNADEEDWNAYDVAEAAWHDSARTRLSLVSRHTLGEWDRLRFRSNVVLSGAGEDDLVGATLGLGSTVLTISKRVGRCVMVNRPQPGIEADRSVLRTILRQRDGTLAIGARIATPGRIAVGDPLELLTPAPPEP